MMKCAVLLPVLSLPNQSKAFRKGTVFFLLPPFSTGCAKMVGFPYAHKSRAFELKHGAASRNTLSGLLVLSSKPNNVFLEAAPCFSSNALLLCAYGNPTIFAHPVENGGSRKKTVPFRNAFDWLGSESTGSKTAHFII